MAFIAPENYKDFYNLIYKKCLVLINLNYWDKITKVKLDTWLANFKGKEEKYLASLILHKLIYRNEDSIISMINNIFFIELPKYLKDKNVYKVDDLDYFRKKLFETQENFFREVDFRFSTIATGDLGESGHLYIKYLREYFICSGLIVDISSERNPESGEEYYFQNIHSSVKTIVFIDDFIGSGSQIIEFIEDNYKKLAIFDNLVFMPLVAHQKGIDEIIGVGFGINIEIIPVETINHENSSFYLSESEDSVFDGKNTIHDLHTFYKELINEKDFDSFPEYGFGNLGLTHVFSTGIPDNNLPLLFKSTYSWQALREKR